MRSTAGKGTPACGCMTAERGVSAAAAAATMRLSIRKRGRCCQGKQGEGCAYRN
jgi:hypothetical protein